MKKQFQKNRNGVKTEDVRPSVPTMESVSVFLQRPSSVSAMLKQPAVVSAAAVVEAFFHLYWHPNWVDVQVTSLPSLSRHFKAQIPAKGTRHLSRSEPR